MASNRASLRTADGSRTPWQPCPPSWRVKWPLRLGGIDGTVVRTQNRIAFAKTYNIYTFIMHMAKIRGTQNSV